MLCTLLRRCGTKGNGKGGAGGGGKGSRATLSDGIDFHPSKQNKSEPQLRHDTSRGEERKGKDEKGKERKGTSTRRARASSIISRRMSHVTWPPGLANSPFNPQGELQPNSRLLPTCDATSIAPTNATIGGGQGKKERGRRQSSQERRTTGRLPAGNLQQYLLLGDGFLPLTVQIRGGFPQLRGLGVHGLLVLRHVRNERFTRGRRVIFRACSEDGGRRAEGEKKKREKEGERPRQKISRGRARLLPLRVSTQTSTSVPRLAGETSREFIK